MNSKTSRAKDSDRSDGARAKSSVKKKITPRQLTHTPANSALKRASRPNHPPPPPASAPAPPPAAPKRKSAAPKKRRRKAAEPTGKERPPPTLEEVLGGAQGSPGSRYIRSSYEAWLSTAPPAVMWPRERGGGAAAEAAVAARAGAAPSPPPRRLA